MCHLVTIGVDRTLGSALPEFGNAREGLAVGPSHNPSLAKIFPPTDLRLEITVGGCSCGLFTVRRPAGDAIDREEAERRRYQKKGWSAAKIDRAIQASRAAHDRDSRTQNAHRFQDAIVALLERTPSIRIFVHMYSGSFDAESIISKGTTTRARDAYQTGGGALPEDVLVEVAG